MPEQPAVVEMLAELRDAITWAHNQPPNLHLPDNIKALQLLAELGTEIGTLRDVIVAAVHRTVASGPKGGVTYDHDSGERGQSSHQAVTEPHQSPTQQDLRRP